MDTITVVKNRQTVLQSLYDRMDETKDLAYLKEYTLTKKEDGKDVNVDNAISVTMNQPAVFANAIISDLTTAVWQMVVEGSLTDAQAHTVEQFIDDNFAQTDEVLSIQGKPALYLWLCNHVCLRGLIGARWVGQMIDDQWVIDCLQMDMRYTPFEFGRNGLLWFGNISYRTKSDIEDEYGLSGLKDASDIEVVDYWDGEKNELWVDSKLVTVNDSNLIMPQKHDLGYPPAVIVIPSTGFMLQDKNDYLEHLADDIFFLNRGLYDELNRSVSVEQTLGMDILIPPYEQETESTDLTPDFVPHSGEVKKVPKGERHVPVPRGDLNNASLTSRQDIQKSIQQGGVNDIDLGDVNQQVSAVWITEQSEIRNKIRKPRLDAIAQFKSLLGKMMIDQFIKSGESKRKADVGYTGKKHGYSVAQLGDPATYTITVRGMSRSKKQEIANIAMAQAARAAGMPLEDIFKNILLVDDPDGMMRRLEIEKARSAEPAIGLFEQAMRYLEEADNLTGDAADMKRLEAMMLRDKIVAQLKQSYQQPESSQQVRESQKSAGGGNTVSLLGQTGLTGS